MTFKVFLDDAQNNKSLNLSGRRIEITDASSADALISLSAIYPSGFTRSLYDFKKEYKAFSAEIFSDLRITNTAQPGEWVIIDVTQVEDEWVYEKRQDVVVDQITAPVTIDTTTPLDVLEEQATTLSEVADLALVAAAAHVQVLPALATRKSCLIKNIGSNPARIGAAPTNTQGHYLSPNESFAVDGTFEVRAFSQLGTTLSIVKTGTA